MCKVWQNITHGQVEHFYIFRQICLNQQQCGLISLLSSRPSWPNGNAFSSRPSWPSNVLPTLPSERQSSRGLFGQQCLHCLHRFWHGEEQKGEVTCKMFDLPSWPSRSDTKQSDLTDVRKLILHKQNARCP